MRSVGKTHLHRRAPACVLGSRYPGTSPPHQAASALHALTGLPPHPHPHPHPHRSDHVPTSQMDLPQPSLRERQLRDAPILQQVRRSQAGERRRRQLGAPDPSRLLAEGDTHAAGRGGTGRGGAGGGTGASRRRGARPQAAAAVQVRSRARRWGALCLFIGPVLPFFAAASCTAQGTWMATSSG